jgi:hypothetical protein
LAGTGLTAFGLSYRLGTVPSWSRCSVAAVVGLLSLFGLDLVGVPDDRGVLAFLVGMSAALCAQQTFATKARSESPRLKWLALSPDEPINRVTHPAIP